MARVVAVACVVAAQVHAEDPWADAVVAYAPVSPQAGFSDAAKALGKPVGGGPNVPNNGEVVTVGAAGGSITLRFDTPVTDDAANPFGIDAIVYGNALWVGGNPQRKFQEPAVIEISADANNNGVADDPWYLIPGSLGLAPTPFPVVVEPAGADNEPPFTNTLIAGAILNPNGGASEFTWGYGDMNPTAAEYLDNYVRPDDPTAVGITARSGGGDGIDIATAVDAAGSPAGITSFDFIRITGLVDRTMGALGLASPEVAAVADVAPAVDGDGDGIVDEFETRVAGTDPARRENTILPLEIPALEGGSPAGTVLGEASDGDGNRIRLYSKGQRSGFPRTMSVVVDIAATTDSGAALPVGGLVKSGALRVFSSSESDFAAAQIEAAEFTIAYASGEIAGLDEPSLVPYRLSGGAYTDAGITAIEATPQANLVTFRSTVPGTFILAGPAGTGDDTGPGPRGTIVLTPSAASTEVGASHSVSFTSNVILDQDDVTVVDGTLFTVAASAGTVTTADADGGTPGVQVASVSGAIAFTVQAPNGAQTAAVTAASVAGSAYGEVLHTFVAGPPVAPVTFDPQEPEGEGPIVIRMISSVVRDGFGNVVADGTLLTVVASDGTITSGDADGVAAGHQVLVENGRAEFLIEQADTFVVWTLEVYDDAGLTTLLGSRLYTDADYPEMPLAIGVLVAGVLVLLGARGLRRR